MIKSVYDNQQDILDAIKELHAPDGFDCDCTYGKGAFWKDRDDAPKLKFDIDPQSPDVLNASSTDMPLLDTSINSLMFDPPFLTYIKKGREHNSIMAKRFSGYWRYDELEEHYKQTAVEAQRVLRKNGVFIVKCQDIIHNHKIHCTHHNMINWCEDVGFRLLDLFILVANKRMPVSNGKQKHARIYHSYFLVFKRK